VQRLKTRAQFQATLAGETVARTSHFALHCAPLNSTVPMSGNPLPIGVKAKHLFSVSDVWMGAMVPKRWAKRAVTRNAVKRQIYTVSALLESSLSPVAHVVRLRTTFDRKLFASATSDALKVVVCAELNQLFAKAVALRNASQSRSG
jgi:ribonuclease P protein component